MSRLLTLLAASEPGFVPSNYMPALKVEIAFTSGYTTPDADRVWTDVSEWVELDRSITTTFGRQDERSTADANDLTLVLDNSDGRFTAGRAASPYYPNVKVGRPIRLSLMTVSGYTSVRFVGFVNQWPVEWDGTDAYAQVSLTGGSRLSRLGLGQKMRSVLEQEILADSPSQYYTLGDPQGSTAASESSGSNDAQMVALGAGAAVVFGDATGPAYDGLTALTLAGGQYLSYGGSASVSGTAQSVSCFMLRDGAPAAVETVLGTFTRSVPNAGILVRVLTTGVVEVSSSLSTQVTGSVNVCDGATHHLAVTRSGSTWNLYVDGVLDATTAGGTAAALTSWTPQVGDAYNGSLFGNAAVSLSGTVAHAAFWAASTLNATRVAAHADAGLTGFAGERTDERLERILEWTGVAAAEISTQTGDETMTYQQTAGQSVVDALREVESTEGGVLFDGRDGRVTFHNRSHRYTAPVAVTLDMAEQQVEADYAPKLDRTTLVNDVTVDNPTTGETARSVDQASADEYGTVTSSAKSLADSFEPLQQKAAWLVASYAEPRPRVPSLTVDVLAQVGSSPSAEEILALTIGSRIRVVNQPAQADATTADYFVEGYTEVIGGESYRITFNLSPAHPSLSVLVLDDVDRGLIDDDNVLAL